MAPTDGGQEPLERLLSAGGGSRLALVLRSWLVGARAALSDAAANDPNDPGLDACQEVISWLDALVPRTGQEEHSDEPPRHAAPPAPTTIALTGFLGRLVREPQVISHLDAETMRAWRAWADDPTMMRADRWETIQVRLLRLPESTGRRIRDDLWHSAGHQPDASDWHTLFAVNHPDEALIAPLDGHGRGVRSASAPDLDEEVDACLSQLKVRGELSGDAAELAVVCSALLTAVAMDDDLWLCLESLQFSSAIRLDDVGRRKLRREMIGRLSEYARHQPYSEDSIRALVAVDEAVHAVVHLPVAARGSWWGRLWAKSSDLVEREAKQARSGGRDVDVRPLILDYPDIRHLTRNDLAVNTNGEPGDVLACLRMYASIDGRELPGRVMYRASR